MNRDKLINWGIFLLLSFIWGSSFILMKASSKVLNGWQIGSLRIFFASIAFLPFAIFHFSAIPRRKLPMLVLTAIVGNLIPAFLFAIAIEKGNEGSLAGILNSLTPLFVIIIGTLFFKAKIHMQKIAGVLVGFIGLFLLSLSKAEGSYESFSTTLLILCATLLYGININLVGFYLKDLNPVKMATVSLSFMSLPTALLLWQQGVFSLALTHPPARWPIAAAGILGISGSAIATAFFYTLIKRAGGVFASLVTYGVPVVAVLWGLWDQENITLIQIACLLLILSGVYLANRTSR